MAYVDMSGRPITRSGSRYQPNQADHDYFTHAARSAAPEIIEIIPDLIGLVKSAAGIVGCLAIGAGVVVSQSRGRSS